MLAIIQQIPNRQRAKNGAQPMNNSLMSTQVQVLLAAGTGNVVNLGH